MCSIKPRDDNARRGMPLRVLGQGDARPHPPGARSIRPSGLERGSLPGANPGSDLHTYQGFQRLCRRTTAYQGRLEMSVLGETELDELMAGVVRNAAGSAG